MVYSLSTVLAVAKKHCFYDENITYPPKIGDVEIIAKDEAIAAQTGDLSGWPLLQKKSLYKTIVRLVHDESPENTYRESAYTSITGGGRGNQPLFFLTDVWENRRQRAQYGNLLALTGTLTTKDWVVSLHSTGNLYRALDLVGEIVETAGATVLPMGAYAKLPDVLDVFIQYRPNVVAGDSSQVANFVSFLADQPKEVQEKVRLDKIIYTSEVLTPAQHAHIRATLGDKVKICSFMASAEVGPWALSNHELTGERTTAASDFIYDTRTIAIEVMPDSCVVDVDGAPPGPPQLLPQGETGNLIMTSLSRLRHPLIRYVSGDIGSVHPLPENIRHLIPEADRAHLQILRLEGRDKRLSFDWEGEYVEYQNLAAIVEDVKYGIVQWQAIVSNKPDVANSLRVMLELRLLPSTATRGNEELFGDLISRIKTLIGMAPYNEKHFIATFLENTDGFEKSKTGNKVIRFINRYK